MDHQTQYGKTPFGVVKVAKKVNPNITAIALAGSLGKDYQALYNEGFDAMFSIAPGPSDLENLMKHTLTNIEATSEAICRLLS